MRTVSAAPPRGSDFEKRPERPLPFPPALADRLASAWRPGASVKRLISSWENFVFEAAAPGCDAILRVGSGSERTAAALATEMRLLSFLLSRGERVPRPLAWHDPRGELLVSRETERGTYTACVFERLPGRHIRARDVLVTDGGVERLGHLLGCLHWALAEFEDPADGRPGWLDDGLLARTEADRLASVDCLDALAGAVSDVAAVAPAPGDFGLVHADFHGRNLLIREDGELSVIDFDDCCHHWLMYDLGVCLNWLHAGGGGWTAVRQSLLEGYRRAYHYSPAAEQLLDKLAFIRAGLDYKFVLRRLGAEPTSAPLANFARAVESAFQRQLSNLDELSG